CVDRFNGMFAFAIWSVSDSKLFLARDPLGMKPLYYTTLPGDQGFVFASEIKAFLALPDFKVCINRDALEQFLEFGYTFEDHATSLEGVFKLPPGHSMEVVDGVALQPRPFFTPPAPVAGDSPDIRERERELYETL